ncbi:MAG: ATP-binding protein [Thermodesulfobacteriota bacterium]
MFINRKKELEFLRKALKADESHLIIIYGKRRVGKTELIKQLFKGISHIYFLADKSPEKDNLKILSEKVGILYADDFLLSRGFGNWYDFFKYIKGKGKLAIAIDEFPYLIEANRAIPSIFQKGWDEELRDSGASLILLGSSIGMMETEVLGYKSPLFGRRTAQMLIQPFCFGDSRKFFPKKSIEECMYIYATLGGIPAYLLQFDPEVDLWKNIRDRILTPEAYLYSEPEFILREELREPRNYFSILRAISAGKTRAGEIINETGFEKNIVGKYLSVLTDLKIVKREVPVTEKSFEKSKKGVYTIDDNFFRFWFNFVFPNKSFIQEGEIEYVIEKKIRPRIDIFTSLTFEEVCRSFVRKEGVNGLRFNMVGWWWSKDTEIDVVAINEDANSILFGEAKWSTKKVGMNVLEDLRRKASRVAWGKKGRNEYLALFSRTGFTDKIIRAAQKEKIFLVEMDRF